MKIHSRFMVFYVAALTLLTAFAAAISQINQPFVSAQTSSQKSSLSDAKREEAYRANNLGAALLERFDYKEAVAAFRRALEIDPNLKLARINLAIALFNLPDYEAALTEARAALEIAPESPHAAYILGLITRTQNRSDEAIDFFKRVLKADPNDVGANVNLGQIYMQERRYAEAADVFRKAVEAESYNATALYNLATALLRAGNREEGQKMMARFQALRQTGAATSIGQNYLEQGRYSEAVVSTGAEAELVNRNAPKVTFEGANVGLSGQKPQTAFAPGAFDSFKPKSKTEILRRFGAGAALFDFDGDGDLDFVKINNFIGAGGKTQTNLSGGFSLFRNNNGKFVDVTKTSGDLAKTFGNVSTGVIAGDFDNDNLTDLFVVGYEKLRLFRNLGKGRFEDVSAKAKLPDYPFLSISAAFADADHDGDLDIFIAGFIKLKETDEIKNSVFPADFSGAPNILLRNNGNSTFTDISAAANINPTNGENRKSIAVIPTDFDNRRDIDFLVVNYGGRPNLFRNRRDGSFADAAEEVGLNQSANWTSVAAGDFNKDSFVDFFFGKQGGAGVFAVSDGRGKFNFVNAPRGTENASAAQFLDYDNDGLLDFIAATGKGFVAARNLGDAWSEARTDIFKIQTGDFKDSRHILSADADTDGDIDLFAFAAGAARFLRNSGGEANTSKLIRLAGRVSNRTGVGAKIDLRAGSLTQKLETYAASPAPAPSEIHFGLGKRERADAVRVIWTSGAIQAEIEFPDAGKNQIAAQPLKIEELDRKPSSCPYLYAWNGERFEFITDFLGGGEMAYSLGNGKFNTPDADEYVRITSEQLKPRGGKYELRVTNELEEVLYLDRFQLVAVDHAEDTEIYPNEGAAVPTAGKFVLYATRNEKPVLRAVDGFGNDLTEAVRKTDRNFYDTFKGAKIRGYAEPHELILTLDDKKGYNGKTLLLLTGWTDYAFSSDNVAAAQAGLSLQPPKLQVKNKKGEWQTVIESIGFSVGRPQTVVVDLTGRFLSANRQVRILTNMKTLWDKIAVDASEDVSANLRVSKIEPKIADLRERGFSLETKPDGKEPVLVDYETVLNDGRWKYFSGDFTRTGNVLPLINSEDDVFVISKTGDELVLSFDENDLPPLETKMKRTFLLYSVGYSKEMDINSASPDQVLPLPFRNMKKYPYGADEQFPMTVEKQRIYDEYTTRRVKAALPRIESALAPITNYKLRITNYKK